MDLRVGSDNGLAPAPAPRTASSHDPLAELARHLRHAQLLPLGAVRLIGGPLREAQDRDLEYVLALDVDRLVAPYRQEAGLPAVAEPYGNWEGDGMGGHIGGHLLSACALLLASTGDERVRERLTRILDELQRCHDARTDGFLGGVPNGAALGVELAGGRIEADLFDLNGRWVPLYNLHKTLSGLLDAVVQAGELRALPLAVDLAEWWMRSSLHLDETQFEQLLRTEPGGMMEAFTTLGALTGDVRYLIEARRFAHREVLDPLLAGVDALDGLHANTQIPKVIGYEALGQVTGDAELTRAAEVFWRHVVEERTVAIGGNSVREHFHASGDFATMITDRQGPEGCNTVNMIELSVLQYLRSPRSELVDYVERALFNHVLGSQHPVHGGLVYFTPMRPAHYRVYSRPETSMWCCVGSGMEAHARHGAFVAVRGALPITGEATLDLLLHVDAEVTDVDGGLRVTVGRAGPAQLGAGRLTVHVEVLDGTSPSTRVVRVRRPAWSPTAGAQMVGSPRWSMGHVAGAALDSSDPDWFVVRLGADREGVGATLEVDLPAALHSEALPDGSPWAALVHGPLVMAAASGDHGVPGLLAGDERMAHVAAGPLTPLAATPVIGDLASARTHPDGTASVQGWALEGAGVEHETSIQLHHLAGIHDQRYTVYWPTGDPRARYRELQEMDTAAKALEVIDEVAGGEQQPESDHHLAGSGSSAGRDGTLHWRSATGWFSYVLSDPAGAGGRLVVRNRETPGWADVVLLDGEQLEERGIDPAPDGCVDRTFIVPAGAGSRVVEFRAQPGSSTRQVVVVRLL